RMRRVDWAAAFNKAKSHNSSLLSAPKTLCHNRLISIHVMNTLLPPSTVETMVRSWLLEDTPAFDVGGCVVGDAPCIAKLYGKADGVLAGVPFLDATFRVLNCCVEWHVEEGAWFHGAKDRVVLATVQGSTRHVLLGERTALNVLSRCCGVATRA